MTSRAAPTPEHRRRPPPCAGLPCLRGHLERERVLAVARRLSAGLALPIAVALLAGCGAEWHQISATQTAQAGGATATPTPPPVATARLVLAGPATPTVGAAEIAPPSPTPEMPVSATPTPVVGQPLPTEPPAPTWTPTSRPVPTRPPAPATFVVVTPAPGESPTPGLLARPSGRLAPPSQPPQRPAAGSPLLPPAASSAGQGRAPTAQPATKGAPASLATPIAQGTPTRRPALPAPTPAWTPPPLLAAPTGRPPTPSELLALGSNRTLRLSTFHYRLDASAAPLDVGYGLRATVIEGDAQQPGRSTLVVSGTLDGRPGSATFLDVDGRYYRQDPLTRRWRPLDSPLPIDVFEAQQSLAAGMNVARAPQQVADEPIDGTPCHHVIATLPAVSLTSLFGTPADGPPVRADYWIASGDLAVRQVTLTGKITYDATSASQVVRITLSRLGSPVAVPSP